MGNHAAKVGDQATKATEHLRKRMTIRRRRPDQESEFSAEEIQRKFSYIPTLTEDEKEILRSSWAMISRSLNEVRIVDRHLPLRLIDKVPKNC